MDSKILLGRKEELRQLKDFLTQKKSGLVYVRGRRRVGKSALLTKLQETTPGAFYFFGTPDSTTLGLMNQFADHWDQFTGQVKLTELKKLSWIRIFSEVTEYAKRAKNPLVLIFDEIQWIAKTKSGFVGSVKQAWQDWEHLPIKVIICGSSNKFFIKKADGEETILRGLKTRADIWIPPFSLTEVREYYFSRWKNEEIALTYMMLGGIPYYLNQIKEAEQGFIHSMNNAVFTSGTIFLEEVDEVLRLEFNQQSLKTVKKILGSLGQDGKSQADVQKATGLPLTTVARTLDNLSDYGIAFMKTVAHREKQNESGIRYYLKDFYLNFYFQVLEQFKSRILGNTSNGLLFPQVFENRNHGYYVPGFSGKAFELLVRTLLEKKTPPLMQIHSILALRDGEFDVLDYWDKGTQIDLLVEHQKDRISRVLECKWIGQENNELFKYLQEVLSKKYEPPKSYAVKYFLVLSRKPSDALVKKAKEQGVGVIGLEDLF